MDALDKEIKAYEAQEAELLKTHPDKFVVFKGERLQGAFNDLDGAAGFAVQKYSRGPYLIRQVGAPPLTLPASVDFRL